MRIVLFSIFILVALVVFSALTYYLIYHLKKCAWLKPHFLTGSYILVFLFTLSTVLGHMALSYSHSLFAFQIMTIGYCWLAFLFLFLCFHGVPKLIIKILNLINSKLKISTVSLVHFVASFTLSFIVIIYGHYEAKHIITKKITIRSPKISKDIGKIKIAQISDVHFGPTTTREMAIRIKKVLLQEKPDMILSTGDMLDKHIRDRKAVVVTMKSLTARYGKYAITGNHEFISGITRSEKFIKDLDFHLLRNESITIPKVINLVGTDDPSASRFGVQVKVTEESLFKRIDPSLFTILLKHQPRINSKSLPFFDLQLSGHTHAGQIFPFTILVKAIFPYLYGSYDLEKNKKIYVNQGTGSWGPPVRFLTPPEITIITLESE